MFHVMLDPDGTTPLGLAVIVHAQTGVVYETQCDGLATDHRRVEGFLVPLGSRDADQDVFHVEEALAAFFAAEFKGHPYVRELWTHERVARLAELVKRVPMWRTTPEGEDQRLHLTLDEAQLGEATEAWLPVLTPYGAGTLVFDNCD